MSTDELDLVSTEDLIGALNKRCDALVFIEYHNRSSKEESHCVWYRGGRLMCLGLADQARWDILDRTDVLKVLPGASNASDA